MLQAPEASLDAPATLHRARSAGELGTQVGAGHAACSPGAATALGSRTAWFLSPVSAPTFMTETRCRICLRSVPRLETPQRKPPLKGQILRTGIALEARRL